MRKKTMPSPCPQSGRCRGDFREENKGISAGYRGIELDVFSAWRVRQEEDNLDFGKAKNWRSKKSFIRGLFCIPLFLSFSGLAKANELKNFSIFVSPSNSSENQRALQKNQMSAQSIRQWSKIKLTYENEAELADALSDLEAQGLSWEPEYLFSATISNEIVQADLSAFDTYFSNQWALYNPIRADAASFGGGDIDLVRAHQYLESKDLPKGTGVYFSIDSGIDFDSPEFTERVIGNFNSFSPSQPAVDDNDHGTHTTSIAVAAKNQFGITGVAPDAALFASKALNADNQGSTSNVIDSVKQSRIFLETYKRQNSLDRLPSVANFSLGSTQRSQALRDELLRFSQEEVLIVASAGNAGTNNDQEAYYPCNYDIPNLLCVAASDRYDIRASFSNFGRESVDIFAPGRDIFAAVVGNFSSGDYTAFYENKSGTSQSAPHVSGVALLIWAANPELTALEVKRILLESVDRIPGREGDVLSGGRLNAYRAVLVASGDDASLADRTFQAEKKGGGGCQLAANSSSLYFSLIILFLGGFFLLSRLFIRPNQSLS